ncbi:MAG: penicillin-binding protein 2, partial [Verrucomicrobiota bacterium]
NYADFYLRGADGWRESEKDGRGRELAQFRTLEVPAADGYTVVLSLDSAVQRMAEQELAQIAVKFQPEKATIIVSDAHTGFVLALANWPTFDLNEYNQVPADAQSNLNNVAATDIYEPGSVFKIVAAAGALEERLVTPATTFDCTIEKIDYGGRMRPLPHEDQDHHFDHPLSVAEILARSSNRGAVQLAMQLGDQRFYQYARAFGFGQRTGFAGSPEVQGKLKSPADWDVLTITRMPMGQSVNVTVLQMQQAMGVIASGGQLLRPQVIREIRDATGRPVYRFAAAPRTHPVTEGIPEVTRPLQPGQAITENTARTMARLLMGVASKEGTAPEAAIPGFEVAGKTGTTQKLLKNAAGKLEYSNTHHVASFVGFFPASNPQVVISVIVDDADAHAPGGRAYGAKVAAPSFRHLAEQLIPYLDIKPTAQPGGASLFALKDDHR